MAITDQQKLDFLFKKLGFGATKTDANNLKQAVNEEIPSPLLLNGTSLLTEADAIPSTKPTSSTYPVKVYQDAAGGENTVETNMLGTASTNRSWVTGLTDWIPPQFGSTYQIKVYLDNAGAANPESTGTQLFAAGSGNNDEWFFDYQSGILNFIGTNLPSGIGGKRIYIAGARYIGKKGNRFAVLYSDSLDAGHLMADSANITRAEIITAVIDSADIMHAIIDSADITLGKIVNVQATNLTADSAHIKRLSADSMSLSELTANIITANQIQGPANLVIDPAAVGDATGLVQILGNLQVEGTTTTINSTTVSLNDKNLVLADSAINPAAADGAGLTVKLDQAGNVATLLYKSTEDKWEVNKDFHVPNLNADSADISLLRSDSAVITNADITNLNADSARIKIFQLDSGSIGNINSIDSARAEKFHIDLGTGRKLDVDSASFGTLSAGTFRMATTPNRFLVADANNVVGTSVNFIGNNARVDFYNAAVQIQNTGFVDVTGGVNVGSGTALTGQIVTTNNLHTAKMKISSIPAKRIPFTDTNDSISGTDDLQFGSHIGMFQTHDGVGVGFNALMDSGNYRFTVDKSSGKITNTGGFKIGRHNNIPTGQFIFTRPYELNTSQQSEDNMLPNHNRDFYGIELSLDSGQLISTASRNEFKSPILQSVSSAPQRRLLDVKGLGDSNLFAVFADGSLDFFGQLRRKGVPFAGGGIFEKDSNTQNAFFVPKDDATIQNLNQFGFGFVAMNQRAHEQGTFISKLQHTVPSTHQQYSNVIQRQKYNLSVDGTFAIRGDIDSSGVDYVISPGAVFDWTNPDTNQTNKVNYADDSDKSRLLYIPSKAIVRAGFLQDSAMRGATMGMFSTGTGYRPIAQGIGSIAMGVGAAARSNYSISMGYHNDVSSSLNIHTVAIGSQNTADPSAASTQKTTFIGHDNHMRGNNSVVIGVGNNTTPNINPVDGSEILLGAGDNSVVIGTLNKIGLRGASAASNGAASVVIGRQNELGPTTAMYAMGTQNRLTVRAAGSYVFGAGAYMDAGQTLALGLNHKVAAPNATAIGTRAQVDSNANFSIVIGLDDATGQSTDDPNLMSVQGGNVSIGSGIDKFTDVQFPATGNLYVGGSLIVAGSILEETAPGVTSSSTPFTDDGRDVSSNLSGTVRRFGFNDPAPYQSAVFKGPEGFQYSANLLTPGVSGTNGYTINPYPFVDDDDDPSTPQIPTGEVDSALYDSNATENSMMSYIGKTGTLKIGTFSGGAIYDTYLRPGRVGFQSISLGKNNINAGLRTTVIGQGNNIQRGGGPRKVFGTNRPLNPGDSLNVASLRASDMIVIGDENVYDSAATGKKVMVLGHNNIIKGSAENKIVIGGFAKPIDNSVLSGGTMYDREIIMKYADSIGQDSLNNTHIAIGKNKVSGNFTIDMRGDLHLDSGSRIIIGDETGLGLAELPRSLFSPIVPATTDPTLRGVQTSLEEANIGGGIASITTDQINRIVVTTQGNHNLPSAETDSTVGVTFLNVPTTTDGITGLLGDDLHFIPRRIDATSFFLLQDSYRSDNFVRSGVQAIDEDGDTFTVTKVGNGATSGTVQRIHYARPVKLPLPINIGGDLTAGGRGAMFRADSLGVGFTAAGIGLPQGAQGADDRRHYNFTAGPQGGLEISKDVAGSFATFPIKINGTPLDTYLDNTLSFAKLADITNIVDQAYVQARVSTDEFFVNHADALFFKPSSGTKTVQIGLNNTDTTSTEKSTYALSIKTLSGNGVINIKDPSNSINADTTSPIQINGVNWPTDNYLKNIIDGTYIQSQVSVSNSTITNAIDEAYLSTIIDSDYVRARVKDSDEFQTSADGKSVFIAHTPNTFDVKLGIGTATPTAKLEVTGHIKGDSATFEGPTLIQGHTLHPKETQFVYTVNGTQSVAGEVFLNNDVTNINANTTVLNSTDLEARIAAAGTSDSNFTVDLGGPPDKRFFLIYKIKSNGDSVDLPEGAGIPANDVIPQHGGGTGHIINSNAWHFDPANDRFLKIKKFVFESDGAGNIIDQAFHFRDRRLQTTIGLTSLDDAANTLEVNKHFATIERLRSGIIIDSDVAGASVAADGLTININSEIADLDHAFGDSIRVGDVFRITDFENRQISGLTVHGPTIFTSGGTADSAENKSGLVTFQDSALFNGKVVFADSASFVKDITIPVDKQILSHGLLVFDSDIAATRAFDGIGGFIDGQGGATATTIISHPRAPQNRFQMFREVKDPATKAVIDRKLMSFDSNVMEIVDSNLVGSRLNSNTQWNFATDARQVSSLFYQGNGGVIIGGNQTSIQYSKGGGLISDSDTKLQLNQGNAIFKQDTWDGIGGSTTFDVVPPIGEGSRFMWIPQRAALRAGAIEAGSGKAGGGRTMSATAWDDLFVGQSSVALGANTDAKNYSVAIGYKVTAGMLTYTGNDNIGFTTQFNHQENVAIGSNIDNRAKKSVAIGIDITHKSSTAEPASRQVSIGEDIRNDDKSDTVAIGSDISSYSGVAIGSDVNTTNYQSRNLKATGIGHGISAEGNAVVIGKDISGSVSSVVLGRDGNSGGIGAVAMGINSDASQNGVSIGRDQSAGVSGTSIGRSNSTGQSGTSIGRDNRSGESTVAIGINNAVGSHRASAAIGVNNTSSSHGSVVIGGDNSASGQGNTVVVGKSNRSNSESAVVLGYGQSSNSYSAVVVGKGNSSNSGQYTGRQTVIVGLNNSSNGKQNQTHGSGPMVAVGIANINNTSGFYFGQNNSGNNQMHVYGSDNNNLTNGDFGYVFGTGASVEKKVTGSGTMSGMQYGANNTTIDNGFVFGTSNTGRQGGYAFGAGNYAWLSGLAFGYDNAVTGDSNPVSSTEFPMAFGRDNAVTNGGIVFGENNTASGTGLAIGANNTSTGSRSLAIGSGVTVSGTNSIGIGLNNNFSGNITANNTFAVIGGRVGIGTVTPNTTYLMEIDGGHLNIKAPFDYYRHDVRLEDYIKNDVVNFNYITKQNADSDYVKSAVTLGDYFQPTAFFRRNNSSQNIEYTGSKQVGIGKVPGNIVGFPNPKLDVEGGINFTTGLYLSGTRIIPSIDSIGDLYVSHQTLEYNIGPDSAIDFFDSAYVFARVSRQQPDGTRKAFGFGLFDSVQNVIDPTYINTRIDTSLFLDSSEALALITEQIDENTPFRFNNTTGQVQLTSAEITAAGKPNLYGGVKVGIGIAPNTSQTLRVGGGVDAMEINGLLKLTGNAAKILIEKNGILTEISDVQFKDDATTGNIRYDGGKNVGINLGIGTIASATLDVGGNINAATGLEIGGQDLLTGILTGTYIKGLLETVGDDGAYLDSAGAINFIDSDYIRTIADSAYIKTALDSDYIKTIEYFDGEKLKFGQAGVHDHIQSFGTGDFEIKHVSGTGDGDSAEIKFFNNTLGTGKFLHLKAGRVVLAHSNRGFERDALSTTDSGVTIDGKLNRHAIADGTENFAFINPKIGDVSLVDSSYIRFHADSDYIRTATDSAYIRTAADSAYILSAADSAYVLSIADSDYILTAADSAYIRTATDSDYIKTAIDSAHVDLITGIGQRDVDFNQRSIFFKNSVANTLGLPSASQNEGSVFVTRDNYKANVATNGNFEKIAHHKHASDSDYILSVGRSSQFIAASGATTINQIAHGNTFVSAEYLVSLDDSVINHSQVSKILMTYNGNGRALMTNYGIVSTMMNDSQLGSFSIDSDGTNLLLKLTKSADTGTVRAKIQRTIL